MLNLLFPVLYALCFLSFPLSTAATTTSASTTTSTTTTHSSTHSNSTHHASHHIATPTTYQIPTYNPVHPHSAPSPSPAPIVPSPDISSQSSSSTSGSHSQSPAAIAFEVLGGLAGFALVLGFLRCLYSYKKTPNRDRVAAFVNRHRLEREMEELERNNTFRGRSYRFTPPPPPPYYPKPPSYDARRDEGWLHFSMFTYGMAGRFLNALIVQHFDFSPQLKELFLTGHGRGLHDDGHLF